MAFQSLLRTSRAGAEHGGGEAGLRAGRSAEDRSMQEDAPGDRQASQVVLWFRGGFDPGALSLGVFVLNPGKLSAKRASDDGALLREMGSLLLGRSHTQSSGNYH